MVKNKAAVVHVVSSEYNVKWKDNVYKVRCGHISGKTQHYVTNSLTGKETSLTPGGITCEDDAVQAVIKAESEGI